MRTTTGQELMMKSERPLVAILAAIAVFLAGSVLASGKAQGNRKPARLGLLAAESGERGEGGNRRPPADDQIIRFPVKSPGNPGRVAFSHLRHFNALGEKHCKTCHSPEMGLITSPAYASRVSDPAREPHASTSLGRFCGSCHNGKTRRGQVGALGGRPDGPIFTTAKTGDPASCHRCHAPRDHGADFTAAHGGVIERRGLRSCFSCHAHAWGPGDRRLQSELLAAERTLKGNPDDPKAALAVGPNNFCVYCHRRDSEWREGG
jgi:hypothetical protein